MNMKFRFLAASLGLLATGALCAAPAMAEPNRRFIEVRREFPHGYRPVVVAPVHMYRGVRIVRHWGPRYPGFAFYYSDAAAWTFLGLAGWQLAMYTSLNEAQLRAHEAAIVDATTAPINDQILWNDGAASGTVTATREGHTTDGRTCREFTQEVTVAGKNEKTYGTACQEPDGAWKIVGDAHPK